MTAPRSPRQQDDPEYRGVPERLGAGGRAVQVLERVDVDKRGVVGDLGQHAEHQPRGQQRGEQPVAAQQRQCLGAALAPALAAAAAASCVAGGSAGPSPGRPSAGSTAVAGAAARPGRRWLAGRGAGVPRRVPAWRATARSCRRRRGGGIPGCAGQHSWLLAGGLVRSPLCLAGPCQGELSPFSADRPPHLPGVYAPLGRILPVGRCPADQGLLHRCLGHDGSHEFALSIFAAGLHRHEPAARPRFRPPRPAASCPGRAPRRRPRRARAAPPDGERELPSR